MPAAMTYIIKLNDVTPCFALVFDKPPKPKGNCYVAFDNRICGLKVKKGGERVMLRE